MFQLCVTLIVYTQLGVNFDSYLLGKVGYVFGSTDLFVCLSVNNITQKAMKTLH